MWRIAVFVLVVVFAGIAYSKEHPNAETAETKKAPETEQRGSDINPVTVKIIPAPDAEAKAAKEERNRQEKASDDKWVMGATVWLAFVTTILAGVTAGLWIATYRLAKDAKRTADRQAGEMKDSLRIASISANAMDKVAENIATTASQQMRAYCVVVVGSALYQVREKNIKFKGIPRLINTGHTPAHGIGYRANAAIMPVKLPVDFDFPLPKQIIGSGVLGPGQVFDLGTVVDDFCADDEIENIKHGNEKVLHIWGIVTYRDVFGENRETRFCQSLLWIGDGQDAIVYGYYNDRHNEAT